MSSKTSKKSSKKNTLSSQQLCEISERALEDLKGQSICHFDVKALTTITDYMMLCTGTSSTHIKALADEVVRQVKEAGGDVVGVEGKMQAEWVLVDVGGVVVHIMLPAVRTLYNLEELWNFNSEKESEPPKHNDVE